MNSFASMANIYHSHIYVKALTIAMKALKALKAIIIIFSPFFFYKNEHTL